MKRIVPGSDRADHADRLADDQRIADLLLPLELGHHLRHRAEVHRGQSRLDDSRELDRHPDLLRDQSGDLIRALGQGLVDPRHRFRSLLHRSLRPPLERLACGLDRPVHVLGRALRDPPDHFLGRRVDDSDRPGAVRLGPLTPDVELVADLDLGFGGGCHAGGLLVSRNLDRMDLTVVAAEQQTLLRGTGSGAPIEVYLGH